MRATRYVRIATFALAGFVGACSSEPPSGLADQPVDLGTVLSKMSVPSLSRLSTSTSTVPVFGLPAPVPSSCSFSSTSRSFVCPTLTIEGMTIARSFTLLDASNNPQSQFEASTTAAVRMNTSGTGTVTTDGNSFIIDLQQEMTLSGLLSGTHTLNGVSTTQLSGTFADPGGEPPISFGFTLTMGIANLVLPSDPNGYPASGTITMAIADPADVAGPLVHLEIAFNGTSRVAVTIKKGALTTRCTFDLASEAPSCV